MTGFRYLSYLDPMDFKKYAGVAFAIAFLMAIVLFTGTGRSYISMGTAKIIFMIAGALGLFLNLISFKSGQHSQGFNFFYWAGSIILFAGLTFLLMRWPYGYYIIVTGLVIVGVSFFIPERFISPKQEDSDLLDDMNH